MRVRLPRTPRDSRRTTTTTISSSFLISFSFLILMHGGVVSAVLGLEGIRDVTRVTDFVRGRVEGCVGGSGIGSERGFEVGTRRVDVDGGKLRLGRSGGDGDRCSDEGEVEDVLAASLKMLCSELLIELEKLATSVSTASIFSEAQHQPQSQHPLLDLDLVNTNQDQQETVKCTIIKTGYHSFLHSTAKFIQTIQESEMRYRFSRESAVFEGVVWLQGLWASRRYNTNERSFIEQQMELYAQTGCFEKGRNEVVRSGVEVVEFLNDVLDLFP